MTKHLHVIEIFINHIKHFDFMQIFMQISFNKHNKLSTKSPCLSVAECILTVNDLDLTQIAS